MELYQICRTSFCKWISAYFTFGYCHRSSFSSDGNGIEDGDDIAYGFGNGHGSGVIVAPLCSENVFPYSEYEEL